ncbi:hypothetical protein CRUP_001206, partial [Coryphaenoides rupestris]
SCEHGSPPSVRACLSRAAGGTSVKARGGVNGRGSAHRAQLKPKPEVPRKPAHLQSPKTELPSPVGRLNIPLRLTNMEERGGGGGGGGRGGGEGGVGGAQNRDRPKDKSSKVSNLISRFEENSTESKREVPPLKLISRSANCSPAHHSPPKTSDDSGKDRTPSQRDENHVAAVADPGPAAAPAAKPAATQHAYKRLPPPVPAAAAAAATANGTVAQMERAERDHPSGGTGEEKGAGRLVNGDATGTSTVVDGVEGSQPLRTEAESHSGSEGQELESDAENGHKKEGESSEQK